MSFDCTSPRGRQGKKCTCSHCRKKENEKRQKKHDKKHKKDYSSKDCKSVSYTSSCGDRSNCFSRDDSCNYNQSYTYKQPCYVPYPKMGACCNAGICSIQEERDCLDHGGYWMGTDTRCWEVRCPEEPVGACCLPGSQCVLTKERNCWGRGLWMGPYSSCNQCNPFLFSAPGPLPNVGPFLVPQGTGLLGVQGGPILQNGQGPYSNASPCGNPLYGRSCNASDAFGQWPY